MSERVRVVTAGDRRGLKKELPKPTEISVSENVDLRVLQGDLFEARVQLDLWRALKNAKNDDVGNMLAVELNVGNGMFKIDIKTNEAIHALIDFEMSVLLGFIDEVEKIIKNKT